MSDERFEAILRKSMSGPVPRLAPGFEGRLMRGLERQPKPMSRVGWIVLAGYGVVSVFTCVVVMLGQQIDGWTIAGVVSSTALMTAGMVWALRRQAKTV
jgi:hypothetical protein